MSLEMIGFISVTLLVLYFLFARGVLKVSGSVFWVIVLGAIVGLSLGALLNITLLSRLPEPWGNWVEIIANLFIVAVVINTFYNQSAAINDILTHFFQAVRSIASDRTVGRHKDVMIPEIIVDTSVVIDGRILEVARAGFLMGKLIVPKFVLDELHLISDSEDDMKRSRGRRGLEVLNELKKLRNVNVEILHTGNDGGNDVDSKIVHLSRERKARLITLDFNLNQVAKIQNLDVLNINELHDALRPVVLPGEELTIKLVQKGKDATQAVGYLEDGTMVVVEDGRSYIGKEVTIVVTRMFQTAAGKMIFGKLDVDET
jgi:uncharacterized protein YacL